MLAFPPRKFTCLAVIVAIPACASARAGFTPIILTAGSYSQDMVVEAGAPAPIISGGYTSASMDTGTANSQTSWYEVGYNSASPTSGLTNAGATFFNPSLPNHHYQMAPSYTANNAVLLDSALTSATLSLVAPVA